MKGLSEKIKTDKRFKKQFIACVSAAVIVVCAVAVPVGVHSSNVKKAETAAEEASIAAELTTDEEATAEETTEALTEEAATVEETTADVTVASADTVKSTTKSSTTKANTTKAGTTKAAATAAAATVAETTTQSSGHQWTQAEVDAVVAEAKQYAISKGFYINTTRSINNGGWNNPVNTSWYSEDSNRAVSLVNSKLRDEIDWQYNDVVNEIGYAPNGEIGLNILAQQCTGIHCELAWEIYVVY